MAITPDSVRQLLNSDDYGDRLRAVNQFRELDIDAAFELAQLAANDSNHRDPSAVESLLRRALTNDPEPDVQAAAADAIGGLQLRSIFDDLAAVYETSSEWLVRFSIVAALGELGEPNALPLLQEALSSENELIATAAIGALGELKDERALPLLLNYTDHPDWQVRHRLVQALAQYPQPEAQAALQGLLQDDSAIVAEAAQHHTSA